MAKIDFTFNKIIPVIIYGALILIAITFAVSLLQFNIETEEEQKIPMFVDSDPYATATIHVNDGMLGMALAAYSDIIRNDETGAEENAWHEKGKILNRLGYCNDAVNHYVIYADRFPDSQRAVEGYELAKQC